VTNRQHKGDSRISSRESPHQLIFGGKVLAFNDKVNRTGHSGYHLSNRFLTVLFWEQSFQRGLQNCACRWEKIRQISRFAHAQVRR
jgi:hypothetical protein